MRDLVAGMIAGTLALTAAAEAAPCFTQPEWVAAHVRVFQTELQVAALECTNVPGLNFDSQYNSFIKKYNGRLRANAQLLQGHFKRVYGGGYMTRLDEFVTNVANEASDRSMKSIQFCADSVDLFNSALNVDPAHFEEIAVNRIADKTEVGERCPLPPGAAKTAAGKKQG